MDGDDDDDPAASAADADDEPAIPSPNHVVVMVVTSVATVRTCDLLWDNEITRWSIDLVVVVVVVVVL
jgi:hypothetical protein